MIAATNQRWDRTFSPELSRARPGRAMNSPLVRRGLGAIFDDREQTIRRLLDAVPGATGLVAAPKLRCIADCLWGGSKKIRK